jgi:hypothetical protein
LCGIWDEYTWLSKYSLRSIILQSQAFWKDLYSGGPLNEVLQLWGPECNSFLNMCLCSIRQFVWWY